MEAFVVEVLGSSLVDQAACVLLDALVFPRPSVQFGAELVRPDARVWIARPGGGQPVAFLAARVQRRELYVQALAVDPAHQRQGIGGALLDVAIGAAEARGAWQVRLHVATGNRGALRLYEGRGFRLVRRRPDFYPDGPHGREALELRCEVNR